MNPNHNHKFIQEIDMLDYELRLDLNEHPDEEPH